MLRYWHRPTSCALGFETLGACVGDCSILKCQNTDRTGERPRHLRRGVRCAPFLLESSLIYVPAGSFTHLRPRARANFLQAAACCGSAGGLIPRAASARPTHTWPRPPGPDDGDEVRSSAAVRSDPTMSDRRRRTLSLLPALQPHMATPGQACRDGARRTWQRGAHHGRHKHMGALTSCRCMASAPSSATPASQQTTQNTRTHTTARCSLAAQSERDQRRATARAPTPPHHAARLPEDDIPQQLHCTHHTTPMAAADAMAAAAASIRSRPQPAR